MAAYQKDEGMGVDFRGYWGLVAFFRHERVRFAAPCTSALATTLLPEQQVPGGRELLGDGSVLSNRRLTEHVRTP